MASAGVTYAVEENAFDSFDPLAPLDPMLVADSNAMPARNGVAPQLPSRRRRKRKPAPKIGGADVLQPSTTAPWEVDEERDRREEREDMQKAFRDKIRQMRNARKGSRGTADRSGDAMQELDAAGAGPAGAAGAAGGSLLGDSGMIETLMGGDMRLVREMAVKMGIPADKIPSKRTLMRRLQGMDPSQLQNMAAVARR